MSIAFKDYWIKKYIYLTKYRIPITAIVAVPFYMLWIYWHLLTVKMQNSLHVIGTINLKNKDVLLKNMFIFNNSFWFCMHTFGHPNISLCIPCWLRLMWANICSLFEGTSHFAFLCSHKPCFFFPLKKLYCPKPWSKTFQRSELKWVWGQHHSLSIVFAHTTDLSQFGVID